MVGGGADAEIYPEGGGGRGFGERDQPGPGHRPEYAGGRLYRKIYPWGPGGEVYGLPVYSHLRELPEAVDLAAVSPARFVPQVVADCGELGITRVVVESGGFSELGEQGRALEQEIIRLINRYHLRLIGPNGLGLMNMEIGLSLPFSQIVPVPRPGNISVIAQSGGVGMHVIAWMTKEGLGLNKFLSLGNKLNVKENEFWPTF